MGGARTSASIEVPRQPTAAGARPVARTVAAAHLPVTALTLLWLLIWRPAVYRWARTALGAATGTALFVYVLVPVTPPRLLDGHGFVDTAVLHGQSAYDASSSLTNQFAALPSLHVGWAVLVAVVCVSASTTRWAWLWVLHPVATVAVVVATGNHYWLDAAAGAALVGVALVAAHRPLRTGRRPAP